MGVFVYWSESDFSNNIVPFENATLTGLTWSIYSYSFIDLFDRVLVFIISCKFSAHHFIYGGYSADKI